jgi:hypothetical protein
MHCKYYILGCLTLALALSGCQKKDNELQLLLADKNARDQTFVNKIYYEHSPIAQIINLPGFSSASRTFTIDNAGQHIQIYAVGEILYNLKETEKKYYLKGDDIKLTFRANQDPISGSAVKEYVFAYKDIKKFKKEGIEFKWNTASHDMKYHAEVRIPLKNIGINAINDGDTIDFNVSVGDNDDGFIQSSEIAWSKYPAPGIPVGKIVFKKNLRAEIRKHQFPSHYGTPDIDGIIEPSWNQTPAIALDEVARGYVKDYFDLSATVRSQWDKEFVYFLFEINDSRQKHIPPKKEKERGIFVDYGWIENEKGETIWQMHAKYSKYAGGMLKNQQVDTSLFLSRGNYFLRYVTDESHSPGDWIGEPPATPFYGIVVYEKL